MKKSGKTTEPSQSSFENPKELSAAEMARIAEHGGAFEWLADEPDIYSDEDGEPV